MSLWIMYGKFEHDLYFCIFYIKISAIGTYVSDKLFKSSSSSLQMTRYFALKMLVKLSLANEQIFCIKNVDGVDFS